MFFSRTPFGKFVRYFFVVKNPSPIDTTARNIIAGQMRRARLSFEPPMTQDQLSGRLAAKRISLDRVAITKIECGQRCVFDFEIPVIAEVLRVDVRWLLGMEATGGPSKQARRLDEF